MRMGCYISLTENFELDCHIAAAAMLAHACAAFLAPSIMLHESPLMRLPLRSPRSAKTQHSVVWKDICSSMQVYSHMYFSHEKP